MKRILLLLFVLILQLNSFGQGSSCNGSDPFCTGTTYTFPNSTGGADLGAIDCLGSSPNPAWYYMEIDQNGNMTIQINQTSTSGTGLDVDFALFGPYSSLAAACATIPGGSVVDCSYSTAAVEYADITGATIGQVYVLLLTNYSNQPGTITFNQTGGGGSADCSLLCGVSGFTANPTACNPATNQYSVSGTLSISNPPSSGTCTITNSCGGSQTFNMPNTSMSYNFTGLTSNGAGCTITATFSADPTCNSTSPYTAPASCLTTCNMSYFSANIGACDFATNTYSVDGDIQFTGAPATGQLIVETCGGQQQVFNAPFTSPLVYNITGIPSDGAACDVQVYFTADPACSQTIPYTAPASCACPVDIGTFTTGTTGSTTTTGPYNLCWGDALNVVSNGNNTDPNNIFDPTITYDPGQWLLVYSCPPTVGPPNDINTDPCLLGVFSTADANWNIPNNVGDGSTYYFVPISMYSMTDGYYSVINASGLCYDLGPTYQVTYLPQITNTLTQDCQAGTATATISGGDPAVNGTLFTASGLSPATATFVNTTAANGGTITIGNLQDGDMYSFTVTDVNGCPLVISGGPFIAPDNATITPAGPFCPGDPAFQMTAVDPGGTWSATCGACITAGGLFNPATAGVGNWTITYTIPGACGDTDTEIISVTNLADATINPQPALCVNATPVTFTAATNGGTWSATCGACINASSGQFDPAVAGAGTYTITYTLGGACGSSDTETITVNPLDNATINPAGPFCNTDPAVNLTAATLGGTWSGTGITNTAAGTFNPATAGNGTWTITYTTAGACPSTDTENIIVNSFLNPAINPAGPFCESNPPAIMAAATPGGTWSAPCGACINSATGEFNPTTAGPGTWTISYTTPTSCGATDTEDVVVIADADATINTQAPLCTIDPAVTLTAAQTGGTWSATCGACINAATGNFNPGTAGPGNWTITYTISGACGDSDTETILVSDQLDATITAAGPFCANDPAFTLTGADPGGTWTATCGACVNSTTGSFNPATAGAGIHVITYTLTGSCGDQQTLNITVNPVADASIIPAGPFCEGFGATTITAVNAGGTWSATCGACINAASGAFNTTVAGVGNHTITYAIGGPCPDSQTITVQVTPNADASFVASTPLCDNNNPSQLVPVTPGGTWSATCGTCVTPTGFFNPTAAGAGTHTITYTIAGSCGGTTSQDIVVNASPVVDFNVDIPSGCIPLTVNFTDFTNPAGTTYDWDFGDGTTQTTGGGTGYTYITPGCFDVTLTVTTADNCTNTLTNNDMVCVFTYAQADFTYAPTETTILNPLIEFTNLSNNASGYVWTFDTLGTSQQTNPSFAFPDEMAGSYQVCLAALNGNGCHDTTCQIVTILDEFLIYVPNAFTPDADEVNDVFLPIVNAVDPEKYRLYIFNRWGEMIFESQSPTTGWDGTYRGFNAPSDVYVWKIVLTDNLSNKRQYTGHVTLLR
jgi:gliding motility-associated-like protein